VRDNWNDEVEMSNISFSYTKLWKLLIDKKMLKKDLMDKTGINSSTMAKLGKDMPVSMDVLGRICDALDCNVGDIVDFIKK
jgi:DNA-binding Xre family transcriptional regulator